MSVLIKMEMPKSCAFCRFNGAYCYAKGDEDAHSIMPCPLIPVPPHGRLIDADALDKAFTELRWDNNGLAHWGDRKDWCLHGNEIEALISATPTIIEAEEGE